MKKFNFILVAILIVCLSICLVACNNGNPTMEDLANKEKTELNTAVLTDTHYISPSLIEEISKEGVAAVGGTGINETFKNEKMKDAKMFEVSGAILRSTLDEIVASGYDSIIITGDMCDNHATQNHTEYAEILAEYENKYNIKIFVIPGNHDVDPETSHYLGYQYFSTVKVEVPCLNDDGHGNKSVANIAINFKSIYGDFGYNEAVAVDSNSLSYTADIKAGYRLLCIDNCSGPVSEATVNFVRAQCIKAKADGVKLIAAMHKPINNMFTKGAGILDSFISKSHKAITDNADELRNALAGHAEVLLSGHNHCNDSVIHETNDGRKLVEIMTVSLSQQEGGYRGLEFTKNYIKGEVNKLQALEEKYLPVYLTKEDRQQIVRDFTNYAKDRTTIFVKGIVDNFELKTKLINFLFGDISGEVSETKEVIMASIDELVAFLNADLYGNGNTYEAFYKKYGEEMVKSNYTNIYEVAADIVSKIFDGEENLKGSVELAVLKDVLKAVVAKGYETKIIDLIGLTRVVSANDFGTALFRDDDFVLIGTRYLDAIINSAKVQKIFEDHSTIKAISDVLLKNGKLIIKDNEDFQNFMNKLKTAAKAIEQILNIKILACFETNVNGDYTGNLKFDVFVEALLEGFFPDMVEDNDFPDKNFVMEISTNAYMKIG